VGLWTHLIQYELKLSGIMMTVFLLRRMIQSVIVLWAMSLLVFTGVYAIGNPVDMLIDPKSSQEVREEAIRNLGLDRPLWGQYIVFLKGAVRGNLGNSFIHNIPAIKLIIQRLPATLELATSAMMIAIVVGLPLGIVAGLRSNSAVGQGIMACSTLGFSLPNFWVGLMLVMIFSISLGWLPTSGRGETVEIFGIGISFLTIDGLRHLILPALTLSLFPLALIIRLTKAGVEETWPSEFIKFARAKGLTMKRITLVHILKNILIPVVTVTGIQFGILLAFAVVTETVFAWPGMGKLIIDSINYLDRPVIVAYLLITVIIFIIINLIVDILYSVLDPRVRIGEQKT